MFFINYLFVIFYLYMFAEDGPAKPAKGLCLCRRQVTWLDSFSSSKMLSHYMAQAGLTSVDLHLPQLLSAGLTGLNHYT